MCNPPSLASRIPGFQAEPPGFLLLWLVGFSEEKGYFEVGSYYVALAVLELKSLACLCLLSARIKDECGSLWFKLRKESQPPLLSGLWKETGSRSQLNSLRWFYSISRGPPQSRWPHHTCKRLASWRSHTQELRTSFKIKLRTWINNHWKTFSRPLYFLQVKSLGLTCVAFLFLRKPFNVAQTDLKLLAILLPQPPENDTKDTVRHP